MSDKKLVDFIEEYIDDSELLSELADVQLDDIRLNVERRELELLCSAAATPGELLLRAALIVLLFADVLGTIFEMDSKAKSSLQATRRGNPWQNYLKRYIIVTQI